MCHTFGCDESYAEFCVVCDLGFCRDHLLSHPCHQSSSAGRPSDWPVVINPSTTVAIPRKQHTKLQKDIVRYAAMKYGIAYAVMTYNVNRSMVSRWEKKWSKYQVDPNAQAPPSESTPNRPLAEILDCKPEECNEAENKAIFAYHSHRDVDTFNTRDEYKADAIREVDEEQETENGLIDEDEYWKQVFDGTLVAQGQLDRHYTAEYLDLAIDRISGSLCVHILAI